MTYDAVLFDLDGTLLDTLRDIGESVNECLSEFGFSEHPIDSYKTFVGNGVAALIDRALPEEARTADLTTKVLSRYREVYATRWDKTSVPYDGIPELLDELTARGLTLAVLSNKPHDATVKCVQALLSGWSFDAVFGERVGVTPKPDPAAAREISKSLGIPPGKWLFVGDTDVDIKTARAAGMAPVGVSWGFRPASEMTAAGAIRVIDQPGQLLDFLKPRCN